MMKPRQSKLDAYAEQLGEWELAGKTLKEMAGELHEQGCDVSLGRLSDYLSSARDAKREAKLFNLVASGGRMNKELDAAFAKNPAPEIAQLIRVVKTLVMSLQLQGETNPEMLDLGNSMLKTVLDFAKLETKREEVKLAVDKHQFDATRAAMAKLPELKAIATNKDLSEDQKLEQARLALFGSAPQ